MKKDQDNKSVLLGYFRQVLTENNLEKVYFGYAEPLPKVSVDFNYLSRITIPLEGHALMVAAYDGTISKQKITPEKILFTGRNGWAYAMKKSPYRRAVSIIFMESYIRLAYAESSYAEKLHYTWLHTSRPPQKLSLNMLKCLNEIMFKKDKLRQEMAIPLICALLYQVIEEVEMDIPQIMTKAEKTFKKIIEYTQQYYHSPINRASVSNDLQLNPSYLSRIFKEHSGQNFNSYLNQLRMQKAELTLRRYDLSVKQIAVQCGFTNFDYFIKAFKKHFGITPGLFRDTHS